MTKAIDLVKDGEYNLRPNPDEEMTYYSFPETVDVDDLECLIQGPKSLQ